MVILANVHFGITCKNLEKSMEFYKKFLGMKEKSTLYYGDLIPEDPDGNQIEIHEYRPACPCRWMERKSFSPSHHRYPHDACERTGYDSPDAGKRFL